MVNAGINYWAVLVAGIAYMVLGAVWYSPLLFAKTWLAAVGKSEDEIKAAHSPGTYIWAFVASFLTGYGIARIMIWTNGSSVSDALKIALVIGVCFVLTSFSINDCFEHRRCKLTVINILYHVIGILIIGIIIGAWR